MRATGTLIAATCLACVGACGTDPTLDIAVVHPPGSVITSTTVTVYVSASLTCDAVQFADVDATALAGLQVAQETLRTGMATVGSLAGLPRVDHKVIVARGLGASGELVTGGCTEVDEIAGADRVEIDTQAAVLASISAADATYGIGLTVAGLDGSAIAGRAVSWRVIGPVGTKPAVGSAATLLDGLDATWDRPSATCTSSGGDATLHPVPPDLSGGYAARIRVAWAQDPPPPLTALTKLDPSSRPGTPVAAAAHPCVIGHNASQAAKHVVACLESGSPDSVDIFTASSSGGVVSYASAGTASLTVGAGLYAVPSGSDDVDIIGVDSSGLGKLVPIYGTTTVTACPSCGQFVDVMYVPACGNTMPALLLGRTALGEVRQMSPLGGTSTKFPIPADPNIGFVSAGCVTRFDTAHDTSSVAQVSVFDTSRLGRVVATFAVACIGGACEQVPLPVAGAGVAFTGGAAPAIVVAEVDATGVVLSTVDVVTSGTTHSLLELSRIPSVSVPHRIAAGQLDGDGQLDYAWDNDGKNSQVLQVAYARAGFDGPLSAFTLVPDLSAGTSSQSVVDVQAGPILGDDTDDVLVSTSLGAIVLPSLVTPLTGAVPDDPAPSPGCP